MQIKNFFLTTELIFPNNHISNNALFHAEKVDIHEIRRWDGVMRILIEGMLC